MPDGDERVVVEKKIKEPSRYRVLLHNDDYTSMEFVVDILRVVFHKTLEQATAIMLLVHQHGVGQCGVYTKEVAESRVARVRQQARQMGFPLKCTMEEV
ncbi:MAG: ATP-dependent Clp protease adapter ClpS [Desulfovibrio sp.]|nr:ATP-dependent Clp protease adapter ClpS [Desulfovibrio sp.]